MSARRVTSPTRRGAWPNRAPLVVIAALMACVGCAQRTRILVEVDAEPGVLMDARYERTRIQVRSFAPCGATPMGEALSIDTNLRGSTQRWPARVELVPCADDARRRYEVLASAGTPAADPSEFVAFVRARAVSGYVAGQTRVLRLTLEDACRGRLDCASDQTCNRGTCVPAAFDENLLPRLGDPPPDVSFADGGSLDASAADGGLIDAGLTDAGLTDVGLTDAGLTDVGPTDSGSMDATGPIDAADPTDAAATPPDAYETPDTSEPPTCDEIYGLAAGYQLCSQEDFACQFSTSGTCEAACGAGRLLGCLDESMTLCVAATPSACLPTTPGAICSCGRF